MSIHEVNFMRKNHEQGFTLVELIIIIVIVGILAAVMAARFITLSEAIKTATCKQNQFHIETAQSLFYIDRYIDSAHPGRYAESLKELEPYFPDGHPPKCPSNGMYLVTANGDVECTEPGHHR
jgi:prepilin-type N-terminal cleavage/methylation domain-containing protein